MKLVIQSEKECYDLSRGLELLTCNATVKPSNIRINESTRTIIIPMERQEYKRKRSIFVESYKLISSSIVRSILTIRNVNTHTITDNLHLPEIHLLFGVSMRDKEILLGSVEEQSGLHAFGMSIKVRSYNIELDDIEK